VDTVTPWPGHDLDRVPGCEHSLLHDPQVGAGSADRGEPLDPRGGVEPGLPHPALEVVARDPDAGHLEDGGPDLPPLPDLGLVHVVPGRGEVLAELAVADLLPEGLGPRVEVLAGERVDRLVDAPVVLDVGDLVTLEPERGGAHRTVGPVLLDRAAADLCPLPGSRGAEVDGADREGHRTILPRRWLSPAPPW
jgi:hypothetical protein